MKHSYKITLILLLTFIAAQYIGLGLMYLSIDQLATQEVGTTQFEELAIGERPPLDEQTSYISIIITILIGTGILLLLIKYNLLKIWKAWFFLAVFIALATAFAVLIPTVYAVILALLLAAWKVFKPNVLVHNATELFIYGGIALIFVPLLTLFSAVILLLLISVYDAYAVWQSKHMVTLAKAQSKAQVFAGLCIPYKGNAMPRSAPPQKKKSTKVRVGMLGGGDIAFVLLFSGVVLKDMGIVQGLLIPLFATAALAGLFFYSKKDKFYPAMPFLTAGCLVGLAVVSIL